MKKQARKLVLHEESVQLVAAETHFEQEKTLSLLLDHPEYINQRNAEGPLAAVLAHTEECLERGKSLATRPARRLRGYKLNHCRSNNLLRGSLRGPHSFCIRCTREIKQAIGRVMELVELLLREVRRQLGEGMRPVPDQLFKLMLKEAGSETEAERCLLGQLCRYFEGVEQWVETTNELEKNLMVMMNSFVQLRFDVKAVNEDWDQIQLFELLISGTLEVKVSFDEGNCVVEWLTGRLKELIEEIMLFVIHPLRRRWNGLCLAR